MLPGVVRAEQAGKAVGILQKQYGKTYGTRLVAVTGVGGEPQPKEWHLFAYDLKRPALVSHFVVRGGQIVEAAMLDEQRSQAWAAPVLAWDKVKVGSEEAFKIADVTARAAQVGFDRVDYRLMSDRKSGAPVYNLELRDAAGKVVGYVVINGTNGKVVSQDWQGMAGFKMPWSGQEKLDWQIVKEEMAKVGRDIGGAFKKLKENVGRTFKR